MTNPPPPDPDILYIHPDQVERLPPHAESPPPPPPPPLPPLLNLPELIARYGPLAQGVFARLRRGRGPGAPPAPAMGAPPPTPPPTPIPSLSGAPGAVVTDPRAATRTAVSYLLAGLAGAVATGLAVAAFTAVQQSGYHQAEDDLGRPRVSRSQKRRRRRQRARRRTPRPQQA